MDATERSAAGPEKHAGESKPARFWISLALLAAVILLYVALMTSRGGGPEGTTGPAIGRRLGYLQLEGLSADAKSRTLDDLQGRVTLLNFWGTWCPPCIRELPQIVDLAHEFSGHADFQLLAVSCGQGSDAELSELRVETAAFLQSRAAELPVYADQNGATRQSMSLLLSLPMAYPTTLILDRTGVIRGFWQGYDPQAGAEMSRLVEQLLQE